jgi:hypothetical protein
MSRVMSLSQLPDGVLVVPDRDDRDLGGDMVYVGGNPPKNGLTFTISLGSRRSSGSTVLVELERRDDGGGAA